MLIPFLMGLIVLPAFLFVYIDNKNKIRWLLIFMKINPRSVLYMKPVRVELDGKDRYLKFTFNAMSDFEELMGMGVGAAFQGGQIGFRTIRALYWAGLRHKDKGLTLERTGMMLSAEMENGLGLDELMEPLNKAIEASGLMPKDVEESEDDEESEEVDEEVKNA